MTKLGDQYFALSRFFQFTLWFALIFLIKFDTVLEPPVWDTAMGVFPPAIFLYETNFDVLELVKQPDWWEGGANGRHSFSLWTWFIALVMSVTHSPTITFAVLHITTFAINAFAISVFVRVLFQYKAAPWLALISGLFLLLIPLVLVQIGYIYTESLVMSLGILAWASWHKNHESRAVMFALLAVSMKLTGIVILICISAVLLMRLLNGFSCKRLLLLISMPLILFILISIDVWLGELPPTHGMNWGGRDALVGALRGRSSRTPEILYLIYAGLLAALAHVYLQWRQHPDVNLVRLLKHHTAEEGGRFIALVFPFVFVSGTIVLALSGSLFLNRYMIPIIPFSMIQIVLFTQIKNLQKILVVLFVMGCLVSIYNHNGVLYRASKSFSVVEISHAYKAYYLAQKKIIEEVEKLDENVPIYVSREIDYMMSHPMMGYASGIKPHINGIYKPRYANMSLENFPSDFYAVVSHPSHGGSRLKKLIREADKSEKWNAESVYEQDIGGYEMYIKRVSKFEKLKSVR